MCKNHYGAVMADRCFTPLGTGSAPLLFELGTPNLVIAWQVAVGNRAPISVSKRGVMRRVDFYSRFIEFVLMFWFALRICSACSWGWSGAHSVLVASRACYLCQSHCFRWCCGSVLTYRHRKRSEAYPRRGEGHCPKWRIASVAPPLSGGGHLRSGWL